MRFNLSFDVAIVISLVTVFLFANGTAHLGGYLSVFNIDPTLLNLSLQDKIYLGYLYGFKYLLYFTYILCAYIIIKYAFISLNLSSKIFNYVSRKINKNDNRKHKLNIHNSTFHEELEKAYISNTSLFASIIVMLFATIFLLAETEKEAQFIANKKLLSFNFTKVELKNPKDKTEYFLVKCGSSLCALITKDTEVVMEEPKNIIFLPKIKES